MITTREIYIESEREANAQNSEMDVIVKKRERRRECQSVECHYQIEEVPICPLTSVVVRLDKAIEVSISLLGDFLLCTVSSSTHNVHLVPGRVQ